MKTSFKPVQTLQVYRRLSDGQQVLVGRLAQDQQGTYFQYDEAYLSHYHSLSPFNLSFNHELSLAPKRPHQGLQGVFGDSLPDGWGLLLMDRLFRQHGLLLNQVTAMDRLAFTGSRAMGALAYQPAVELGDGEAHSVSLSELGEQATQIFDGEASEVLELLAAAGSSGGARPKALIYRDVKQGDRVSTEARKGLEPWLIKFTSEHLMLGHEESVCEAVYLVMAKQAGLAVPDWELIQAPEQMKATAWLAMRRFDCTRGDYQGRYHMHSLCGLLDADFRQPSMDYEDLIKASQVLCQSAAVGKVQFKRAMFNLFSLNQDDHTKNWAFLMDDFGQWSPTPFYDVTFSPNPHNHHMTSYGGYGSQPPLKTVQAMANQAAYKNWKEAQKDIEQVVSALANWAEVAKGLAISKANIDLIQSQLDRVYQENKALLKA